MKHTLLVVIILCLMVIVLAGCATAQPVPASSEVAIAVPTSCITGTVPRPDFITDPQLVALPPPQFVDALHRDRQRRIVYEGELEAQIEGCR
jgi:hypothetical protein